MQNIFRLRLGICVQLFAVMVGPGNLFLYVHTCVCNILCRIVSAYRCGCCFICSIHWPFVLRFGAQCATLHAKFYGEYFPPTVRNLCASLCFKRFPCYPSVAKYPALRLQCGVLIYAKYFPFEPLRLPCGMGVRSA